MDANWVKLPGELLVVIAHKLSSCHDYIRLAAVSQSWKSILYQLSVDDQMPLLPPESPLLFLAEQLAEGVASSCEIKEEDDEEQWEGDRQYYETLLEQMEVHDYGKYLVGNTRGLYSLSTRKTYYTELPEASGKLILGTNNGWLSTVGSDLQINLLHPLLKKQIPLPPMNTFANQHPVISLQEAIYMFIQKVAMVGKGTPGAIVMTIYGECNYLAFAKLEDKAVWTDVVHVDNSGFEDVVSYKEKFYAVDCTGAVYMCDIGDAHKSGKQTSLTNIALCPPQRTGDFYHRYLVESGAGLLLVLCIRKTRLMKPPSRMKHVYRSIDFLLWKLELRFIDDCETPSGTFIQVDSLGDNALFIGRSSSVLLQSSEYVRPNSIYFTDDMMELYSLVGGGHNMGIFNMESRTIEPFFQGKIYTSYLPSTPVYLNLTKHRPISFG